MSRCSQADTLPYDGYSQQTAWVSQPSSLVQSYKELQMRFFITLIISATVLMANGCASPKTPSCPLLSKVFLAKPKLPKLSNVFQSKRRPGVANQDQCGCDYCQTVRLTGEPPVEFYSPPVTTYGQVETGTGCCDGNAVFVDETSMMHPETLPNAYPEVMENSFTTTVPDTLQNTQQFPPKPNQLALPPIETPDLTPPPAVEPKIVPQESAPQESAPPNPYVDPRPNGPEIRGITVPELEEGTGFLAPENLIPSGKEKIKAIPASTKREVQPTLLDSVTPQPHNIIELEKPNGTLESQLPAKRIETNSDSLIVLKARPVSSHRINNAKPLNRTASNTISHMYQFDQLGLPVDRPVEFNSLPPVDHTTPVRKVRFKRDPQTESPSDLPRLPTVEWDGENDKPLINQTTHTNGNQNSDRENFVSESTVYQEPILRMTAVPTAHKDIPQDVVAKIRFGKQTIVRGQFPSTDSGINQSGFNQANRTEIPQTRLGTIDR